jgi:3-dehydroquinate synthase
VFIDVNFLKSLSNDEMLNGIAEMIKHGIIMDRKFLLFLNTNLEGILAAREDILLQAIRWSGKIKKEIVERDEKETRLRKILNFGHTIGHAIEAFSSYKMKHGNSIATGMIAETRIAKRLGIISEKKSEQIIQSIKNFGFASKIIYDVPKLVKLTHMDKKNYGERVLYVLPRKVGKMLIDIPVSDDIVLNVLGEMK